MYSERERERVRRWMTDENGFQQIRTLFIGKLNKNHLQLGTLKKTGVFINNNNVLLSAFRKCSIHKPILY